MTSRLHCTIHLSCLSCTTACSSIAQTRLPHTQLSPQSSLSRASRPHSRHHFSPFLSFPFSAITASSSHLHPSRYDLESSPLRGPSLVLGSFSYLRGFHLGHRLLFASHLPLLPVLPQGEAHASVDRNDCCSSASRATLNTVDTTVTNPTLNTKAAPSEDQNARCCLDYEDHRPTGAVSLLTWVFLLESLFLSPPVQPTTPLSRAHVGTAMLLAQDTPASVLSTAGVLLLLPPATIPMLTTTLATSALPASMIPTLARTHAAVLVTMDVADSTAFQPPAPAQTALVVPLCPTLMTAKS